MESPSPQEPEAEGDDVKRSFGAWLLPLLLLSALALMVLVWFFARS